MARYLLMSVETGIAVNGNPFMKVVLQDETGQLPGVIFNHTSLPNHIIDSLQPGKVVDVVGDIGTFNDQPNMKIKNISVSADQNVEGLVPSTKFDYQALQRKFISLANSIQDNKIKAIIIEGLINDPQLYHLFITKPAAKRNHHAHMGGLLEHSTGIMSICDHICKMYPQLNRDLCIAGSLLHDIGKIYEQGDFSNGMDYTEQGKLLGHIVLGVQFINDTVAKLKLKYPDTDFTQEKELLTHIVSAHHGQLDWGSPVTPQFPEAMIVHYADAIDAYMKVATETLATVEPGTFVKPQNSQTISRQILRHSLSPEIPEAYYSLGD